MLDRPLQEILSHLPVSADVRVALCGFNEFREVYDAMISYERADWPAFVAVANRLKCPEDQIPDCYLAAVDRANKVIA